MKLNTRTPNVLVIVDVQNAFCPGGALAVPGGDEIIAGINALKQRWWPMVVMTQDWHPAGHKSFASSHPGKNPFDTVDTAYGPQVLWPDHCVQGSAGAAFHSGLAVDGTELILRKGTNPEIDSYSGFYENDKKTQPRFADGRTLADLFRSRGVERVMFCGLAYDFCVGWHALDARKEGFEAVVLRDLCRSIALPLGDGRTTETAMDDALAQAGVVVTSVASFGAAQAAQKPVLRGMQP